MANSVYQATIEQLEGVLSPRVASQSLQEGLKKLQKTPDTVTAEDIETILKAQVYRRLQVTLPPEKAKEAVENLLEGLHSAPKKAAAKVDLQGQAQAIKNLKDALKPFNLYFEWPETQKLRAQLQLLEMEQEAGRDAHELMDEARAQLGVLEQKLEGQLVTQAAELSELGDAFKQVKSLGGSKVRRLENLIGQIESAQETRQIASGEVERARKLATDLRKLVASAVLESSDTQTVVGDANPTSAQTSRVSEELKRLDLENDAREVQRLAGEFANLFLFEPALAERLGGAREALAQETPLGERLAELRATLTQAQADLRASLRSEFGAVAAELKTLEGVDAHELEVALPVTLSVLETTLPARADVQRVRDLYSLLTAEGTDDPERAAQIAELHQLESEAAAYLELDDDAALQLALLLDASRTQLEVGRKADELARAWPILKEVREAVAQRAATFEPRLDAALAAFKPIASLNTDETLQVKRTLSHLDAQRDAFSRVAPTMQAKLVIALRDAEVTLQELQNVWEATRAVAGQLVSDNAFDDILGIFGSGDEVSGGAKKKVASPDESRVDEVRVDEVEVNEVRVRGAQANEVQADDAAETPKDIEPDAQLSAWLDAYAHLQGVSGVVLFLREGRVAAGEAKAFSAPFHRAVRALSRDLSKLGEALHVGEAQVFILEMPSYTVVTAWPNTHAYLGLIVTTPAMLNPTLKKLRGELPELRDLLHSLHDATRQGAAQPR